MIALGAIGIVYGALIAMTQKDLKELAAYSTLSASFVYYAWDLYLHDLGARWRNLIRF